MPRRPSDSAGASGRPTAIGPKRVQEAAEAPGITGWCLWGGTPRTGPHSAPCVNRVGQAGPPARPVRLMHGGRRRGASGCRPSFATCARGPASWSSRDTSRECPGFAGGLGLPGDAARPPADERLHGRLDVSSGGPSSQRWCGSTVEPLSARGRWMLTALRTTISDVKEIAADGPGSAPTDRSIAPNPSRISSAGASNTTPECTGIRMPTAVRCWNWL